MYQIMFCDMKEITVMVELALWKTKGNRKLILEEVNRKRNQNVYKTNIIYCIILSFISLSAINFYMN